MAKVAKKSKLILKVNEAAQPMLALSVLQLAEADVRVQTAKVDDAELHFFPAGNIIRGNENIARYFARTLVDSMMYAGNAEVLGSVDEWMYTAATLSTASAEAVQASVDALNEHLSLRTHLVGHRLTLADGAMLHALNGNEAATQHLVDNAKRLHHVARWQRHLQGMTMFGGALRVAKKQHVLTAAGAMGSYNKIDVSGATVVTRFPPEPSGYLHIGHVKAAMLNDHYARRANGRLHCRFDDTNPAAEKQEFEDAILDDLKRVGIVPDSVSHTSDFFGKFVEYMTMFIKNGDAFVDTTAVEEMRALKLAGKPSACREQSIERNLELWQEMIEGTALGRTCVVRAKIDCAHKNSCLRDPSLYRCRPEAHHRTGTQFKVYPLYDFACPIIDSLEGITHALRSNEYKLRNPLYDWVATKAGLRVPVIEDFSRLNFEHVLLSKRKLKRLVEEGAVSGWDDPRFPTIRGILRLGLDPSVLRQFILAQGAAKATVLMTMEKLWVLNKKFLDKQVHRYTALPRAGLVPLTLSGDDAPANIDVRALPRHPKVDLGTRAVPFTSHLWLDLADAALLNDGDEVTLVNWGNAVCNKVTRDANNVVTGIAATLNLAGDFSKTTYKLTWLARIDQGLPGADQGTLVPIRIEEYDYLITVKQLSEADELDAVLNPNSKVVWDAVGEPALRLLNKGDRIQLQRIGFFICDQSLTATTPLVLIKIPDGKSAVAAASAAARK